MPIQPENLLDVLAYRIANPGIYAQKQTSETATRWAARAIAAGIHDGTLLPKTPDENAAAVTGSSRRAQELADALPNEPCARCGAADAAHCDCLCDCEVYEGCGGGCCGRGNCSCSGPEPRQTDAPTADELPEELLDAIAERVASERADAAYKLAGLAYGLGRDAAGATPFAGDRDPELAEALSAATSLPRSELLPEVRRLQVRLAELDRLRRHIEQRDQGQPSYRAVAGERPCGDPACVCTAPQAPPISGVPQDRSGDGVPEVEQARNPHSPAAKLRSLRAYPHRSACTCDDCTARDEAEQSGWGAQA